MGLRMKSFNIMGVSKSPVYRGDHEKLIYRRESPKKGGRLGKKEGGVFEGVVCVGGRR